MSFDFDATEPGQEIVLVCELRATKGEACFDLDSLKIRRR